MTQDVEAFDIAIDWVKSEGIYFKDIWFTMHDVALTIQHYQKIKYKKFKHPHLILNVNF